MSKHRRYNWSQLFSDFDESGLSQADFCKRQDLNPTYFSLKLSKRKAQEGGTFTKVVLKPEDSLSQGLIIEVGHCKIHCPTAIPLPSFVSLVKCLA